MTCSSFPRACTVGELLEQTTDLDVVILDLRLGDGTSPRENVARLAEHGIGTVVYTSGEHPDLLRLAARAGTLGVVLKSAPEEEIVGAVRAGGRGDTVLTTEWAAAIDGDPNLDAVDLSPQLQRVLTLYASGGTSISVGEELGVAPNTVNEYLKRIRQKYAMLLPSPPERNWTSSSAPSKTARCRCRSDLAPTSDSGDDMTLPAVGTQARGFAGTRERDRILQVMARFVGVGYLAYFLISIPGFGAPPGLVARWFTPVGIVLAFGPGFCLLIAGFFDHTQRPVRVLLYLAPVGSGGRAPVVCGMVR